MIIALAAFALDWKPPPCPDNKPGSATRCAQRDLTRAEAALQRELAGAEFRLKNCSPRNSTKCYNMPHAIALIRKEQQAWRAYRDAQCDIVAIGFEDTSAETQVRLDCRTGKTVERTEEVRKIMRER